MNHISNCIAVRSLANSIYLLKIAHDKYDLHDINSCQVLKFGGSNDIFLLSSSKKQFVLKIFFARQCWQYNEEHYLFELELQQYLNQQGLSASKPILSKAGKLLDKILLAEGERFFAVYEFEKGKKWEHTLTKDHRFYKLGKALAKLHEISAKFCSSTKIQRILDIKLMLDKSWQDISQLITLPSNNIKKSLYNLYIDMKDEAEDLLKNQPLTLIHGDVHCGNHLYNAKTDLITFIDFELSGYGFINYELSVLKHDLINNQHPNDFICTIMNEFLNGYASISHHCIDQKLINFFVKVRYFFMLGSSFLFYPDRAEFNNAYILNNFITAIKKADKLT